MHIPVLNLDILDHDTVAKLKAAASDAGHEIVVAGSSDVAALWQELKGKYPAVVEAVQKGIADAENTTLSGGEKAVKVALDILPILPDTIKAIPDLLSFAVHGVAEVFAEMKNAGKAIVAKL